LACRRKDSHHPDEKLAAALAGKEEYPSLIAGTRRRCSRGSQASPVKIIYDRAEDMVATTKRHPSRTRPQNRRHERRQTARG
jgi:xanthine dehydrogenase molybdopterin-binding subunit B